jgi:cytochrome c biogenesis protein CcmG/thiol:disulfide interchange protein DsbE
MKRLLAIVPVVAFAVLLVGFAVGLKRDPSILPSVLIGKPVPAFALPGVKHRAAGLATSELVG